MNEPATMERALRRIVLATHNPKKLVELQLLVEPLGVEVCSLADLDDPLEVVEDGATFAANARKKAIEQARHLDEWALGEDSGLVVDALDGAPGVFSARFAGEHANDTTNNTRLLEELQGVDVASRGAHYVCHLTLSSPAGVVVVDGEATCQGRIRTEPAGSYGFGYDPLFEIVEYHRTFGELGAAVKSVLSHRARAMRQFLPAVRDLIARTTSPDRN